LISSIIQPATYPHTQARNRNKKMSILSGSLLPNGIGYGEDAGMDWNKPHSMGVCFSYFFPLLLLCLLTVE
jgi:hypothetical protein